MIHKKNRFEKTEGNTIEIKDINHLSMLKSYVATNAQMYFGLAWSFDTAEEDDERAFALAIASLHEMGGRIATDDDEVIEEIKNIVNKQHRKEYYKEGI